MDPISATGIASSAITFVEFAAGIVKNVREVQKSATGITKNNEMREQTAERLLALSDGLARSLDSPGRELTSNEDEIRKTALECAEWSKNLQKTLSSLRTGSAKGSLTRRNASTDIVLALKSVWKDDELKEAEQFLERCRRDLHMQMTQVLLDRSSMVQNDLVILAKQSREADERANEAKESIEMMRVEVLRAVQVSHLQRSVSSTLDRQQLDGGTTGATDENHRVASDELGELRTEGIMDSLWFDRIHERHHKIADRHESTYAWVFDDVHRGLEVGFCEWLKSGEGVYWITGKAGCGKSTMMKYILKQSRTRELLEAWAREHHGCELVIADHYFWRPGQNLQKSMEGLLRSLLYKILEKCPEITAKILPERWSEAATLRKHAIWSAEELQAAIKVIGQQSDLGLKFCFFIDGLDEYVDSPTDIAQTISDLGRSPSIKLCVSSRPWNEFEYAFGRNKDLYLVVSQHTEGDIHTYVNDVLGGDVLFKRRRDMDRRHDGIIVDIVERSEGVFLWVYLVVRAIKAALPHEDSFDSLQARLDELPSDLETFFDFMLDAIPTRYHEESSKILFMFEEMRCVGESMPLQIIRYLTEGNDNFFALPIGRPEASLQEMWRVLQARLQVRCKDLLVVEEDEFRERKCCASVLHRTVHDFLQTTGAVQKMGSRIRTPFVPEVEIFRGLAADWKFMGTELALLSHDIRRRSAWKDPVVWVHGILSEFCKVLSRFGNHDNEETLAIMDEMRHMSDSQLCASHQRVSSGDKMMGLAVSHSIYGYVQARITEQQIRSLPSPWPEGYFSQHDSPAICVFSDRTPHCLSSAVQTLRTLLERGADPNAVSHPCMPQTFPVTAWQTMILRLERQSRYIRESECKFESEAWADIIILCLQYGARLSSAEFASANTGGIAIGVRNGSSREIIRRAFSCEPNLLQRIQQVDRENYLASEKVRKRSGSDRLGSLLSKRPRLVATQSNG